jgi:uncharacterized protein DUF222
MLPSAHKFEYTETVSSPGLRQAVIFMASSPPSPASPTADSAAGGSGLGGSAAADGDGREWRPACVPDDAPDWCFVSPPEEPDYDPGAVLDRIIAEADAGQIIIPPDPGTGPGGEPLLREPVLFLGQPADLTAADLAGGAFRQGGPATALPPGPALGALTGDAATDPRSLTDDHLLGAAAETLRQQARAAWERYRLAAEFGRRQEQRYEQSMLRGDAPLHRAGEFGAEELGFALGLSAREAGTLIDLATDLQDRLPRTFAGLGDGTISQDKAGIIHRRTWPLSDADAAAADEILAAAPHLRPDSLDRKAYKLACELDPESATRNKDEGKTRRRVEVRQEDSGNASLSVREAEPADVLAARAHIWDTAAALKRAGLPGGINAIRAQVALDLQAGLNPAARLPRPAEGDEEVQGAGTGTGTRDSETGADTGSRQPHGRETDSTTGGPGDGGGGDDGDGGSRGPGVPGAPGGGRATPPVPALITILVPASTLLGTSGTMADVPGLGPLDPAQARDLVAAASRHPATRWCLTATNPATGHAAAHGCARGPRPWTPPPPGHTGDLPALLANLDITLTPIAADPGDHQVREDRYRPSRALAHLIRARTATCPAPGCQAHAHHSHLDHTIPWPHGTTSEDNLSPPCARHHHAKHAPGWKLQQTAPGHMRWTTPSGRTFTTGPTTYDL